MRLTARSKALVELRRIGHEFREHIAAKYEHRAESCATCDTPGACCLDVHFVNVRISRLEAVAIRNVIDGLDTDHRERVSKRTCETKMHGDHFACPLFEPGQGCLVHTEAKPLPCIAHACYENREDLPPESLLTEQEGLVESLNLRTYGRHEAVLPLPAAIRQFT